MSLLLSILEILGRIGLLLGILQSATEYTNVEYGTDGSTVLYGYLATPPDYDASKPAEHPVALVFHAWNGMSDEPVYFADLLAAEGYVALAPDLFRGVASSTYLFPWNILNVMTTPQDRMDADVDAAIAYLEANGFLDADADNGGDTLVSGPGFCFGGTQALELGRRRPVSAVVTLYGSSVSELDTDTSDEDWGLLGADGSPVLGIYGEEDSMPSPASVKKFQEALVQRGVEYNVTIYPGVGHAFVNPEDHAAGGWQAVAAWDQVVSFMNEVADNNNNTEDSRRRRRRSTERRPKAYRHSLAWAMDHLTDFVYGKGHGAPRMRSKVEDPGRRR